MKKLKQTVIFNANTRDLYEAIINPKKHSAFTGAKATNNGKVGGKFTSWDGYAFGKNLLLQKNKKIVQSWSTTDFPETMTEITFEFKDQRNEKNFKKAVREKDKTKLIFKQKNIPSKNFKEISDGWQDYYWKPLKKWIEKE